jgi:hypothetical protein
MKIGEQRDRETGEYPWEAVDRKTEIPQDRQTGRLARGYAKRGRTGETGRKYGGPVDRKTEIAEDRQTDRLVAM